MTKGRIKILGNWVKENIVRIELPIVGYTRCHKSIYFDLFRIFYRLEKNGHADKIDVHDFRIRGGSFVPRHMCWNSNRGISRHSWGVAIDLNVSTNAYGSAGTMHKAIIEMFNDFGFFWGGKWRTSDPMHFEAGDEWKPFKLITKVTR